MYKTRYIFVTKRSGLHFENLYYFEVKTWSLKFLSGNLLVDEIALEALLLRKNIAEIIQDAFAREMNRFVYREARRTCQGCQMDDLSQMKHECMMTEEEEIWICHFHKVKKHLNVDKLWFVIERQILAKMNVYLDDV